MLGYQFERNLSDERDLPAERPLRPCRRHAIDGCSASAISTTDPATGDIGREAIGPRHMASPIRAISTTSSNTVSTPASGPAHRAVRPRPQALPDRRLADLRFGGVPSTQLCSIRFMASTTYPSPAPRHSGISTSDAEPARLLYAGPDQARRLYAGAERPQRLGMRPAKATITIGATLYKPRRQQVQRTRRPDLQFRSNGLAPYVSYATSYNPIIGLNVVEPAAAAGNRRSRPRSA